MEFLIHFRFFLFFFSFSFKLMTLHSPAMSLHVLDKPGAASCQAQRTVSVRGTRPRISGLGALGLHFCTLCCLLLPAPHFVLTTLCPALVIQIFVNALQDPSHHLASLDCIPSHLRRNNGSYFSVSLKQIVMNFSVSTHILTT